MNKIHIFLGRYCIALQGTNDATEYLSQRWKKYLTSENKAPKMTVSLHYMGNVLNREGVNGWHVTDENRVTYYKEDMPCFAVSNSEDRQNVAVYYKEKQYHNMIIGIQHAIMLGLSSNSVGLHGVTVICRDKVVILSAPSGTGKTTLSKLLRNYNDTAVVNGDFALLSLDDSGKVIFEPTPFCGSSGICHNHRLYVDQIVFLEQATENKWHSLTTRQALMNLLSNVFVPEWNSKLKMDIQETASRIVSSVPINSFGFLPETDAAMVFDINLA